MGIIHKLSSWFRRKNSSGPSIFARLRPNDPVPTEWEKTKFATEAFIQNYIVYAAISDISDNAGKVPYFLIDQNENEIDEHPILDLLEKPNPYMGAKEFRSAVFAEYNIFGDSFIRGIGPRGGEFAGLPRELWRLRPDWVKVEEDDRGFPVQYEYRPPKGGKQVFPIRRGVSEVMHWKTYNPLSNLYGLSPIQPAGLSVDQYNAGDRWNLSLQQNQARPSGALEVPINEQNPSGTLDDNNRSELRRELNELYTGFDNAGRPLLLEGGLKWVQFSMTMQEMDWTEGMNRAARSIALALGYPPQLLGIKGDSTYNNQQEAREALWSETIIPLVDDFVSALNRWLIPKFGDQAAGYQLRPNYDVIETLQAKRKSEWERLEKASFLTPNEKREAAGYERLPIPAADSLFVPSASMPIGGIMEEDGDM